MHICLPDAQEVKIGNQRLRYKQLLHLHQNLARRFKQPYHQLPAFPAKKLLSLSEAQIELRRQQLEKYLQNIGQDKAISSSFIFNLFLSEAQRESTTLPNTQTQLDIELVNGQKIRLQIMTYDSLDTVLNSVCRTLGLKDTCQAYFCLCLCGYDVISDKLIVKRRFSFFEAPYLTLQMANHQQQQIQQALQQQQQQQQQQLQIHQQQQQQGYAAIRNGSQYCDCNSCLLSSNSSTASTNSSSSTSSSLSQADGDLISSSPLDASAAEAAQPTNQSTCCSLDSRQMTANDTCISNGGYKSTIRRRSTFVTHQILLRKSYWDPLYDTYILDDQQAVNLLFIQTVYDIKHSLMFVDLDTYQQLESLLASDAKLEYILLARTLKYYNYVHFEPCYCDYPRPQSKVLVSIGSREINMRVLRPLEACASSDSGQLQNGSYKEDYVVDEEFNFKVPLIKCWRLTSMETLGGSGSANSLHGQPGGEPAKRNQLTTSLFGHLSAVAAHSSRSAKASNNRTNQSSEKHIIAGQQLQHAGPAGTFTTTPQQQQPATQSHTTTATTTIYTNNSNNDSTNSALQSSNSINSITTATNCMPQQPQSVNSLNQQQHQLLNTQYELSFEYLVSKDTLKWITISSDQAIFISISLQGVVDELVSKRDNLPFRGSASLPTMAALDRQPLTYMQQDGSERLIAGGNIGGASSANPLLPHLYPTTAAASTSQAAAAVASSRLSSSTSSYGYQLRQRQFSTSLDLAQSLKKGPSSIINDAFEGEFNDDDF